MKIIKHKINIPEEDLSLILGVVRTFNEKGFECYLVGGSVRDLLMGYHVYDYDFATNARPDQVMKLFRRVIPTGIKHGTVSLISGRQTFEVTTYRSDGKYIDGRRPENVNFSDTLKDDIERRDFTINGLACDLINGEIIDYVDGLADMERKIIRTIGSPEARFGEDGLRPFRACRFAAKLNFIIDDATFNAITRTLDTAKSVSAERIRDELIKLFDAGKPSVGIEYMRKSGLLDLFLPELSKCHGVTQNRFHRYDIYYHSLYSCDEAQPQNPIIRLSALLHDIGKLPTRREGEGGDFTFYNHEVTGARMARKIMTRLKFSNDDITKVTNLILNHMFHYTGEWTDGAVRRFMRKVGVENLEDLFSLRSADSKGNGMRKGVPSAAPIGKLKKRIEKIIEDENAITVKDLDINGYVIMEVFGVKPGPIIGKILNELLETILDFPEMNTREILLTKAREIYEREITSSS
jgi:tRNA nucleotidyltransferase (CCA-adding enzyme)